MSASLTVLTASGEETYDCSSSITIGRIAQNDIMVQDPKVSRHHATIRVLGDGLHYIADMGSSNGTFLNSNRVVSPVQLKSGDVIEVGDYTFTYNEESESKAEADVEMDTATLVTLGNKVKELTMLVSDIKNYTSLSEQVTEDMLAMVMGDWCRTVSEVADANGAVVDKFIGDAVMMRWLTSRSGVRESVYAAVQTAVELNNVTDAINDKYPDLPVKLGLGVGINTGKAALGNVGGSIGRDYTALGDSVNMTFRIESATRTLGADVLLAKSSYSHLDDEIWSDKVHSISVKGKSGEVDVCALSFTEICEYLSSSQQS